MNRALLNESDAEVSARPGISLDAVKKAWRHIYERVAKSVYSLPREVQARVDYVHMIAEEIVPAEREDREPGRAAVRRAPLAQLGRMPQALARVNPSCVSARNSSTSSTRGRGARRDVLDGCVP